MIEENLDSLLDDLGNLGLDTTEVFYRPKGYDKPVNTSNYKYDYGQDYINDFRTACGTRMSSLSATDDLDHCLINIGNGHQIFIEGLCQGMLNSPHRDATIYIGGEKSPSGIQTIPKHVLKAAYNIWKDKAGVSPLQDVTGMVTPGVATLLIKAFKYRINPNNGRLEAGRYLGEVEELLVRIEKSIFFPSVMPIAMKVAAKTVGMDLVAVKPMPLPSGLLAYIDFLPSGKTPKGKTPKGKTKSTKNWLKEYKKLFKRE